MRPRGRRAQRTGAAWPAVDVVEVLGVAEVPTPAMVRARAEVVVDGLDRAGHLGGALLRRREPQWVAGTPAVDDPAGPRSVWLRRGPGGLTEPEAVVVRDLVAGLAAELARARELRGCLGRSCVPTDEPGLALAEMLGHGLARRHHRWQRFAADLCRRRSVTLYGRVTSQGLVEELLDVDLALEGVRLASDDLVDDLLLRCGRPVPLVDPGAPGSIHRALPRGLDDPGLLLRGLVDGAVALLPVDHRARYDREWTAELEDLPFGARLPHAVRLLASARRLRRALTLDLSDPSDRREPWGRR